MDIREFTTGVDERKHWYYQTKSIPLLSYFNTCVTQETTRLHLLDIGAGSGFFSQLFLQRFDTCIDGVHLIDTGYGQDEISRNKLGRVQKETTFSDTISDSFILMMDLLEHVADETGLLVEIRKRTRGRNYFFATVPAFNFLWSSHDEFLGHYRRYSRAGLVETLRRGGFVVERAYYLYASILPLVFLVRKLRPKSTTLKSDLKPTHPLVNALLKSFIGLEARVSRINTLFGVTCVAEGTIIG